MQQIFFGRDLLTLHRIIIHIQGEYQPAIFHTAYIELDHIDAAQSKSIFYPMTGPGAFIPNETMPQKVFVGNESFYHTPPITINSVKGLMLIIIQDADLSVPKPVLL